ncbi:MAG TPA: glycosyltransferase [Cyclobacteriaceae bacterium]|nr:glycosyltransferase [Cyclobacteriaceae bacterium]
MKVLFFLRRIGPYHHARFQAAAASMDIVAVETRPSSEEYSWQFKANGKYKIESFAVSTDPEAGLRGNELKKSITGLLDKYKPDVLVNTGWADAEYNQIVVEAAPRKIPLVVISDSRLEAVTRKFYVERMKRVMLRAYSSALVAGTESTEYITGLGFDRRAVFKPWDVVDNDVFTQAGRAPRSPYDERKFVCIGRFIEEKNLHRMIDGYAGYVRAGGSRKLVLAGGGKLKSSLEEKIRAHNLTAHVEMYDFVQQDVILQLLGQAFALVLPSISDQWGLAVNEAMAFGLPVVVSSRCGCAVDLVKEGRNGVIFDPYNISAITDSLMRMDKAGEEQWNSMCKESQLEISNWGLNEFATGLADACSYALASPSKGTFTLLHKFLAR